MGTCEMLHYNYNLASKMSQTLVMVHLVLIILQFSDSKLLLKSTDGAISSSSLINAVNNFGSDLTHLMLVSEDVQRSVLANQFIKVTNNPVWILKLKHTTTPFSKYILTSTEETFYSKLFKNKSVSDQLKYYILWTWPVSNGLLEKVFSLAWEHNLTNVFVFIEQNNTDVNVYKFYPFGPNYCRKSGPPVIFDTWNFEKKTFLLKRQERKFRYFINYQKNLYGCPVKVLLKNRPPDSFVLRGRNKLLHFLGPGGKILDSIKKIYNFTLDIQVADEDYHHDKVGFALTNKTMIQVNKNLLLHNFDFAFGVFSYLLNWYPNTDFSHYFMTEKYAFHVPCGTVVVWTLWRDYYMEFSPATWASVALVFFVISVGLTVVTKMLPQEHPVFANVWQNVFTLWAMHVESPVTLRITTNSMRLCLALLMFYCMIVTVAYQTSLNSFLMAPLEVNSIQSWEQLDNSDLKLTGTISMHTVLEKISVEIPIIKSILQRYKIKTTGEFSEIIPEVTIKRDTACFAPESMIAFYNSIGNEESQTGKHTICQVMPYVAESPASTFLVKKGSPFLYIVNRVTVDHMQAGLMNHFGASKTIKTTANRVYKNNQEKYSMKHAKGSFFLLITGVNISFLAFLYEIINFRLNNPVILL